MNKKVIFNTIICSLFTVGLVIPSFAQNTVIPTEPVTANVEKAPKKADSSSLKPKKEHKHHKGSGKMGKKGHKKAHKKAHKKVDTEKQTGVVENQEHTIKINN